LIEETKAGIEKAAGTVRFVAVGGAVRAPQRIVWTEDLTVLAAISATGGVTDAAKDHIRLTRGQETRTLSRKQMLTDAKKDESLRPGDRLEIEE
jgi:protein involved in polysaccharide export with SLBB domain